MTFDNISPLDFRYCQGSLREQLNEYLSENATVRYQARVEAALARGLAKHNICSQEIAEEITNAAENVTAQEVYEEDKRIKHYTRALVNCLRSKVGDDAKPYVHFTATSFDVVDTAKSVQYKRYIHESFLPLVRDLQKTLIALAEREAGTIQIGRTHGQHAVPITFGYAIAEYVDRLGNQSVRVHHAAEELRGKMSGAVGSHNSQALFLENPLQFEKDVLAELDLSPARHSTQIVQPEFLLDLLHSVVVLHGILANLADDMRHLQRSEIAEVAEEFEKDQVGSSTMPHKRNPWNFENVKSMWKVVMPRLMTYYMDQICEHQRDLSNSASARFVPELLALVSESVERMNRIVGRLVVEQENLQKNLDKSKEMVIAEAIYLLLAAHGHPDAHEYVRKKTLLSQETGRPLREIILLDEDIAGYIGKLTPAQRAIIEQPETYTGICKEKTMAICDYWRNHDA